MSTCFKTRKNKALGIGESIEATECKLPSLNYLMSWIRPAIVRYIFTRVNFHG